MSSEQNRHKHFGRDDRVRESVTQAQKELHREVSCVGSGSSTCTEPTTKSNDDHQRHIRKSPTGAAATSHGRDNVLLRSTMQSRSYGSGKKGAISSSPPLSLGRSGIGPDEDANPLLSGADVAEDECETPRSKTDASESSLNPVVVSSCPKPLRTHVSKLQVHQDTDFDDVETSAISPTNVRMSPIGHGGSHDAVRLMPSLDRHIEAGKVDVERAGTCASPGQSIGSDPADEKFRFFVLEPAPVRSFNDIGRSIVEEVRTSYGRNNFMEQLSPLSTPSAGASPSTEVDVAKMSILSPEFLSTGLRDFVTYAPNMRGTKATNMRGIKATNMRGSSCSMVDAALLRELDAGARCAHGRPLHHLWMCNVSSCK